MYNIQCNIQSTIVKIYYIPCVWVCPNRNRKQNVNTDTPILRLLNFYLTLTSHQILGFLSIFMILMSTDRKISFAFNCVYRIRLRIRRRRYSRKTERRCFWRKKNSRQMLKCHDIFRKKFSISINFYLTILKLSERT